jgi:hypothetical protein
MADFGSTFVPKNAKPPVCFVCGGFAASGGLAGSAKMSGIGLTETLKPCPPQLKYLLC